MENLTRVAVALVLGAGAVQAAPFRVVSDGPDSVWVLDAGSGELTWCRVRTAVGAKVIDVFGGGAQVRESTPHRGTPACEVVLPGTTDDPRIARVAALLGHGGYRTGEVLGRYGTIGDYGMGGLYGAGHGGALAAADGAVNIFRPRTVNVYAN